MGPGWFQTDLLFSISCYQGQPEQRHYEPSCLPLEATSREARQCQDLTDKMRKFHSANFKILSGYLKFPGRTGLKFHSTNCVIFAALQCRMKERDAEKSPIAAPEDEET